MQKADVVLSVLREKSSKNSQFVFERVYRYLFNNDLYSGFINGEKMGSELIDEVIKLLKDERFSIRKHGHLVKIVKRGVLELLDAIFFTKKFKYNNKNSAHIVLNCIKQKFSNVNWIIKGKFDNSINDDSLSELLNLVKKRINDTRFLNLLSSYITLEETDVDILNRLLLYRDIKYENMFEYYVRLDNEFIIGCKGNKNDALNITKLLEQDSSVIKEEIRQIYFKDNAVSVMEYNIIREFSGKVYLFLSKDKLNKLLEPYRGENKPRSYNKLLNRTVRDIIGFYNNEIQAFKEQYKVLSNFNIVLKKFRYYQYHSLIKTIACKEKISSKKVIAKYGRKIAIDNKDKTRIVIGFNDLIYTGYFDFNEQLASRIRLKV